MAGSRTLAHAAVKGGAVAAALAAALLLPAEPARSANVCKDRQGKVTMQDRPCPVDPADQLPPPPKPPCTLTPDEQRRAELLEEQFLQRFHDERSHRAAELIELNEVAARIGATQVRLDRVMIDYRRLLINAEFVPKGSPLPPEMSAEFDAVAARSRALAVTFREHEAAVVTIQSRYRRERETLGLRWSTTVPGVSACAR